MRRYRPTAEIVADLRAVGFQSDARFEAAQLLEHLDSLRPTCPDCNGEGVFHEEQVLPGGSVGEVITGRCDCTDGQMPWERIVAIVQQLLDLPRRWIKGIDLGDNVPEVTS